MRVMSLNMHTDESTSVATVIENQGHFFEYLLLNYRYSALDSCVASRAF